MPTKLSVEILNAAIAGFEEQKKRLDSQIAELRQQLNGSPAETGGSESTKRRTMSAAARKRIAAAQRKRWAQARKPESAVKAEAPARKKRRLSASGRRAIIKATKRRWAAARAAAQS